MMSWANAFEWSKNLVGFHFWAEVGEGVGTDVNYTSLVSRYFWDAPLHLMVIPEISHIFKLLYQVGLHTLQSADQFDPCSIHRVMQQLG
jgi:hypothetical protein